MITKEELNYKNFLRALESLILEKEFNQKLKEVINIDKKHFEKEIDINILKDIIDDYKTKEINENSYKKIQVLLYGNPEIVFKLCIEAVRNNVSMIIGIEDFCVAQNTLILKIVDMALKNCKLKLNIKLENLLSDEKIMKNNENVDFTLCVGNSNTYNSLENKINDLRFYPYNIFDIYIEGDEFEELKSKLFDFAMLNGYEFEILDSDIEFDDIIDVINENGYGFCSILLSKDRKKQQKFKEEIGSEYVVINKNPFTEINFKLEL